MRGPNDEVNGGPTARLAAIDLESSEVQHDRFVERSLLSDLPSEQRLALLEQVDASLQIRRVISGAGQIDARRAPRLVQLLRHHELSLRFLRVGGQRRQRFLL